MLNVTLAGIRPTQAMIDQGCPVFTPELLAAVGARYSRNGEGLTSIMSKIEDMDPDKAVDSIFGFVDYGHQSIADMVPVAMFIDHVSLYLVMKMWHVCPTAGGQESSTRYIEFGGGSTVLDSPHFFGPSQRGLEPCTRMTGELFAAYEAALRLWDQVRVLDPSVLRIPEELLTSVDPKEVKKRERIIRNYAFDRARYFIPMSAYTNVMMLMSARGWVQLIQYLYAMRLPEATLLAAELTTQLERVSPRMVRHAKFISDIADTLDEEFELCFQGVHDNMSGNVLPAEALPFLEVSGPWQLLTPQGRQEVADAMLYHKNRYQVYGSALQRLSVLFGWEALPIGEIRDLNRHRTGTKHFPIIPVGTYVANDEIEALPEDGEMGEIRRKLLELARVAGQAVDTASRLLYNQLDRTYVYCLPLGAQCRYEHTTQAHLFAYQVELRTGLGTHYQYARRMRESLALWHERFPETKDLLVAGTAEPE